MGVDPGTNLLGYGIISIAESKINVVALGVLKLAKYGDHYKKLKKIFEKILSLIDTYKPDELAIEAPFYGTNVQSMLKLGRAQGTCISAALYRSLGVYEYSPRRIKQSITGRGSASKEQVSGMLHNLLHFDDSQYTLDTTDALAVALCHYYSEKNIMSGEIKQNKNADWNSFIKNNPNRIKRQDKS